MGSPSFPNGLLPPALYAFAAFRQFILYKTVPSESRVGKSDKLPIDHRTGRTASAHDPAIWLDAQTAIATAAAWGEPFGVGFVFTEDCGLWFLDIDNCLINGVWAPHAIQVCNLLSGCAIEISGSGKGLHLFGTGRPPLHGCRNEALGMEFYHAGRFAALTGLSAQGSAALDFTPVLSSLVSMYFPPDAGAGAQLEWTTEPVPEWSGITDDSELIRRAIQSKSAAAAFGTKASFADLWFNDERALGAAFPDDTRAYNASQADAALAQHLAFWTGKDCERIRRLMGLSKLVRDKWEREDYLPRTIIGAVSRQVDVFQASSSPVSPQSLPASAGATGSGVTLNGIEMSLLQVGTQDSVAQIFASKMAGKMLFDHTRNAWFEWDGTRWRIEGTKKALDFARELARAMNYEGKSSMGSASFCAGVEQFARADRSLVVEGGGFDRDNYLLNTPAGTFDLRTNNLRPHAPEDRITKCTAAAPSSEGGAAFERFMSEITQGDRELAEFLQISSGACLSGAVESHYMLFWIGHGRNGKNTLGDLMMDAMGDYARKVPTSVLMAKAHEGHPTEIANLQGIRLAVSSEINDGEHWNEARINEMTGDSTLSARFMRCDLFTFQRTHKHLIYGNHRPQLRTVSTAIKSRIKIVPFKASFLGREDTDLPRRLRENLGYVLAWLIEGHHKWLAADRQLPQCRDVEAESADYFAAQSTVEMWLSERVSIFDPDSRPASQCPKASELYRDYANWKKERGEVPVAQTRWAEVMRKFSKEKSDGVRYRGLMLIPRIGNVPFPFSPNAQGNYTN